MVSTRLELIFVSMVLCHSIYGRSDPPKKPEAYKFAQFGKSSNSDLCPKIREFYAAVDQEANGQGFIINYGTSSTELDFAMYYFPQV